MIAQYEVGDIVEINGQQYVIGTEANKFGGVYVTKVGSDEKIIVSIFYESGE